MKLADNGFVTLVGAGPGDPGLLTLAGLAALQTAQVVLYDRLVDSSILAKAAASAHLIDVGKNKGNHPTPQAEINQLLLKYAQEGKQVLRLKGGDPYLFGRGAEELELLRQHGIPFRVIPGVTSAIAAPAYAGIPVTHRDYSSSLHIITGHGKDGQAPRIAYHALVKLSGTIVFLMGLSTLPDICANLMQAGMSPEMPVALIENGSKPQQRRLLATLAQMSAKATEACFVAPTVLVVGEVCALAERFDWTGSLPLWGKNILVASSQNTAGRLAMKLRDYGCAVDEFVGIHMEVLTQTAEFWLQVNRYGWIVLTSPFGAELLVDELLQRGIDARAFHDCKFATVGNRTAAVLRKFGIIADYVPEYYDSKNLAEGLASRITTTTKVLLYRASEGSDELLTMLHKKNIAYDNIAAYKTIKINPSDNTIKQRILVNEYDAVTFTSASSVEAFADIYGHDIVNSPVTAICIGNVTATAAEKYGMSVKVSPEASIDSMVEFIVGGISQNLNFFKTL